MGIIYLLKNKINNKCYIGQTIRTFEKRWYEHCTSTDKCRILNNTITKYSPENFETSIIIEVENDKLDNLEVEYIKQYNSLYPNGYNIQTGGNKGKKHCEESREKMRQSKLGEKNPNFGKARTDETKEKIKQSKLGKNHHFYGKELTYEHKLNLSKAHKHDNLPMYMVYLKPRPIVYQDEGYAISNHPKGKNKLFTSKKISLEEKYKLAFNYLNKLNSL
jgi:group I intron endonuclease